MLEDNTLEDSVAEELRAIKKSKVALTEVLRKLDVVANAFEKTSYLDGRMTKQEEAIKDLQTASDQCVTNKDLCFTVEGIYDEVDKRMKILFQEFSNQIVTILESKISYTDCHEKLKEKATWNSMNNLSQQITRIKLAIDKHIKNDFENFKLSVAEELESKIDRELQPVIKPITPKTPKAPGLDVDDLKLRVSALEERVREFMKANDSFDYPDENLSDNEMLEDLERVVMREKRRGEIESPRRYQIDQFPKISNTAQSRKQSGESLNSDPSNQLFSNSIISIQPDSMINVRSTETIDEQPLNTEKSSLRPSPVSTPVVQGENSKSNTEQSAGNLEGLGVDSSVSRDATILITATISSQAVSKSDMSIQSARPEPTTLSGQIPSNSGSSPATQTSHISLEVSQASISKPFIIAPGAIVTSPEIISNQDTIKSQVSNSIYNTNMSLSRNQSKSSMVSRNIPSRLSNNNKEVTKRIVLLQKDLTFLKSQNEELKNEISTIGNAMSNRDDRIKTLESLLETSFQKYEQLLGMNKKRYRIPEVENDAKKSIIDTNKLVVDKVRKEFQQKFSRLVNLESTYDIYVKGTTDFKNKTKKKLNEIIKAIEGLVKICTDLKKEMPEIRDNYDTLKKKLDREMEGIEKQIKDINDPVMDLISNQHRENGILHEELSRNHHIMRNIVDDYVHTLDVSSSLNMSIAESAPSPRKLDNSQLVYENIKLKQENARLRTQSASPAITLKNRFKNATIRQATTQLKTSENWLSAIPEGKKLNLPRVGRSNTTISYV